jgi:hypothetical protein
LISKTFLWLSIMLIFSFLLFLFIALFFVMGHCHLTFPRCHANFPLQNTTIFSTYCAVISKAIFVNVGYGFIDHLGTVGRASNTVQYTARISFIALWYRTRSHIAVWNPTFVLRILLLLLF